MVQNNFINSKKTKSQVTVYMIIAIVLVILLLLFLFLMNSTDLKMYMGLSKHPVPHYVEECIRFNIVEASAILTSQGGFIYEYNPNLTTTKRKFAYSIIPDNTRNTLKNTAPTKDFMELEFARYIEENIDNCINQMERYTFEKGTAKAKVKIYPESVFAELDYSLRMTQNEKEYEFKEFAVKHEIPLGRMVELRNTILDDLIKYPNLMLLD